jgi:hypothetical protein
VSCAAFHIQRVIFPEGLAASVGAAVAAGGSVATDASVAAGGGSAVGLPAGAQAESITVINRMIVTNLSRFLPDIFFLLVICFGSKGFQIAETNRKAFDFSIYLLVFS